MPLFVLQCRFPMGRRSSRLVFPLRAGTILWRFIPATQTICPTRAVVASSSWSRFYDRRELAEHHSPGPGELLKPGNADNNRGKRLQRHD